MKYLLIIVSVTIAAVPFFVLETLVCIWTLRTDNLRALWVDYTESLNRSYRTARRAFSSDKPSKF